MSIVSGYREGDRSLNVQTSLRYSFVCKGRTEKFAKERWIQKTNCSLAFWMLLPAYRHVKIKSDEKHMIFAHELQSALWLTVRF